MTKRTNPHKKRWIIIASGILIFITVILIITVKSASFQRFLKSAKSEFHGGLNRTVTVYDNNGHTLKQWNGKIDIQENDYGNKVLFELNGERKAVYNAIVIVEEE